MDIRFKPYDKVWAICGNRIRRMIVSDVTLSIRYDAVRRCVPKESREIDISYDLIDSLLDTYRSHGDWCAHTIEGKNVYGTRVELIESLS